MPIKFEVKKKLSTRSERVKCVDLHPDLPWVLSALYSGNITISDYSSQTTVKTFEVSSAPVRTAKFIARKQWLICGSDDLQVRVYNYNTMEKVKAFDAHTDYIRCLVIHPTQSYVLSSSDDTTIKIWDWENNFSMVKSLEDHVHYVMQISLHPRDLNTFASCSLDKTIKVWNLSSGNKANFTLTGHLFGVNCVNYYKGDKPYLISGGDDKLVKVWDYQTKQCLHTLDGHANNISSAIFHPELPLIITSSEDGAVKLWHSVTYRLETSLIYNMDRAWSLDIGKDSSNIVAIGYDEGTVVIKIGSDEPVVSMNNGKLVWAKNLEILSANLKALNFKDEDLIKDGEKISLQTKDLGTCDIYPTALKHSPNGHIFALYNDSEYSLYRTQNFKNCGYGTGTDLVWSLNGDFAVRDKFSIILYKSTNVQYETIKVDYAVEELFGGPLLVAKNPDFLIFYDWESCKIIRKIDISAKKVYWNDIGTLICIVSAEDFYVLSYNKQYVAENLEKFDSPEGDEEAFSLLYEVHETVTSGLWISDVFFFTNNFGKINYSISGKIFNYSHTDRKKFLLGYVPSQNRVYLIDKSCAVISFEVLISVTEYQSLMVNQQYEKALNILSNIPEKYMDKLAKFLDSIDLKEAAFEIVRDIDHKFELALQLNRIKDAHSIAYKENSVNKWRQLGDLALINGHFDIAIESLKAANDLNGLFLIFSSLGMKEELHELAAKACENTRYNIAFSAYFLLSDLDQCIEVLIKSKRVPEAALFAKTYCPSHIPRLVSLWKESLKKEHPVVSQKIANPMDFPEEFSDLHECLIIEEFMKQMKTIDIPAHHYTELNENCHYDLFSALKKDSKLDLSEVMEQLVPKITETNPCTQLLEKETFHDVDELM